MFVKRSVVISVDILQFFCDIFRVRLGSECIEKIISSFVQNMIENMILTSYSDKSFLVASCG